MGKTTIIRDTVTRLRVRAGGFYTEEIRVAGERIGFRIVTLDGRTAILSGVSIHSNCRVGKYGVDVNALESVGVAALKEAAASGLLEVVDEIGKMELCSGAFKTATLDLFEKGNRVLGTILLQSHPWADAIKRRFDVTLLTVTRANRFEIANCVADWLGAQMVP